MPTAGSSTGHETLSPSTIISAKSNETEDKRSMQRVLPKTVHYIAHEGKDLGSTRVTVTAALTLICCQLYNTINQR